MPLLYEAPSSTTSEVVAGGDGVLTVVTDPAHAGVLVRVRTSGWQTVLSRTDVASGVTVPVRSGDPLLLVEGEGHAYDHEVHPGRQYVYSVPGADAVTVTVPWVDAVSDAWVKVINDPSRSTRVRLVVPQDSDVDSRHGLTEVFGGGVVAQLRPDGPLTTTLTLATRGRAEHDAVVAAVAAQSVLLVQGTDAHGLPEDLYVVARGRQDVRAGDAPGWEHRRHVVSCVQVSRPATGGARLRMPGWGWAEASAPFASMAEMTAAYPTVWDVLLAGVA